MQNKTTLKVVIEYTKKTDYIHLWVRLTSDYVIVACTGSTSAELKWEKTHSPNDTTDRSVEYSPVSLPDCQTLT